MSGAQPSSLGKYEIRGTLGKGAMGTVYDGWDPVIDRRVAIKTVRLPDAHDEEAIEGLARFKREAQAAGRLTHPNIVGVFDYGETDEVAYIVMEFVEGRSLKDVLSANERMTVPDIVALIEGVLAGLSYSHGRGVVHRDIKPANIMLTADGRAKIADFGIARIEASSMTQAGTVMGTPAYMSPEQFMGQVVDRRTDIYSCGVMLYQMLTGDRPFDGSMTAIMHKAMTTTPPRPSELAVTAPAALDGVVAKAMARRPEDRYESADAFAQALHAPAVDDDPFAGDETIVARPTPARTPPPPPVIPPTAARQGSKLPLIAGGVGAFAVIAAAAVWFLLPGSTPPVADRQASIALPQAATPASPAAPIVPAPSPQQTRPASLSSILASAPPPASPPAPPAVLTPPPATTSPFVTPQPASVSPAPGPAPSPPAAALSVQPQASAVPPPAPQPATPPAVYSPPPQASTPVAPLPAAPVSEPARPARSPAAIEAVLAASLPGIKCTLARVVSAPGGTPSLAGVAGKGQPEAELNRAVLSANPAGLDSTIQAFDGPYCPALDLLRPVVAAVSRTQNGMDLVQSGGPVSLKDNEVIALQVTMPGFAGYLHVAYLQHDATVAPQVPGPGYPAQTYAARARLEFGKARPDFEGWHVGPPFGTDMIVAIASTAPLFSEALPDSQPLASYLASLQTAIDGLRRRGGSVAAAALVLDTRPPT